MRSVKYWAARAIWAILVAAFVTASCSKTPTPVAPTPEPPTPPPVANPPTLACGEGVSRSTVNASGLAVNFNTPAVTDGQGSVTVTCTPASGTTFPIGTTSVTCTATDALNRSATCSFNVAVSRLPQLTALRYLAFGDSITEGEVSPAVGTVFPGLITKNVVVPSVAYPTVLLQTLRGRYATQTFAVSNFGFAGEKAANARSRFISAIISDRPDVVMILHGHNDIPGGVDGGASTGAYEIERMVEEARTRGMRVFLGTVLPPRSSGGKAIAQVWIDDFNARLRIVAARQGVTLVDTYAALRTDVTRYIGIDGLHPTEAGYAKLADTFFQAIQTNLEVR
jgi:lysophospholipase L1-like esterase